MLNAKKQRKTTEWERLEISSKKIRDTKGTFHEKVGKIKDRNGMDLTEAEDIKKKWQEYREELYKKIFTTQVIMMGCSLTWSQTSWNEKLSGP